jgi:hypothetical protein
MREACDNYYLYTDDGSVGTKGLVTDKPLKTSAKPPKWMWLFANWPQAHDESSKQHDKTVCGENNREPEHHHG